MVSSPSPAPDAGAPLLRRLLRRAIAAAFGLLLLLWGLMLAAWLLLHWAILPQLDNWRPAIERQASRTIGAPLRIGRLDVQSAGWVPSFDLHDLRLYDPQGREALRLARVQASLSPRSLLQLQLRFRQVVVDGAQLDVRRDAAGRLQVAGFDWDREAPAGGARLRDWVLAQPELVIRDARLVWTDETRDAPPLQLSDLDLVLRNGLRRHALRIDATPPPQWGGRFTLRGRFTQPLLAERSDLRRWSGTLYAELPQADMAELRRYAELPFELREGDGALRAWAEIEAGQARRLTLDVALRAVSLRLGHTLERLELQQVLGRFVGARDAGGVELAVQGLRFTTGDGLHWPAGNLRLAWQQAQDLAAWPPSAAAVSGGKFSADRLDLDVIARTTARLPVGQALRKLLHTVAPQGTVQALEGRWSGPIDAPDRWQVSGRLDGLNLAAAAPGPSPGRPGLRHARVEFQADERGGKAQLAIKAGALIFPGVWQQPEIGFDDFDAALAWRIQPVPGAAPALALDLQHARFANADAQGEFDARWSTGRGDGFGSGARFPGRIELSGRLLRGNAASIARYLPLSMPAGTRTYVQGALLGGRVHDASFRVRGDLADFPFVDPRDGEFKVSAQAQDVTLAYVPGTPAAASPWPAFTQVAGQIEFDRNAMRLHGVHAALWGYELRAVQGGIADLSADRPVLQLDGQGRGPAADLLRFVRSTPLAGWIGASADGASATGRSELTLALVLPLADPARSTVRGSLLLPGNDLRLRADWPALAQAHGRVDFTRTGFQLRDAGARLLGGDAVFDGGIGADGALRLNVQGSATAEELRAAPALGAASRLAAQMRGQASYRASIGPGQGMPEFSLSSNLVGMQIDLPPPLAKPASAAWPLLLRAGAAAEGAAAGNGPLQRLQLDLGELLQARFVRDPADGRVQRGAIAVGSALPPLPAAGVAASLKLGQVDLDAWEALFDKFGDSAAAAAGFLPTAISLRADELRSGRRRISHVAASLQREAAGEQLLWQADVRADQLEGRIELRPSQGPGQPGRVMARLARLSLPPADAAGVEDLLARPPAGVPALDIVVDDFELRGRKLGRLQVQAVNRLLPGRAGQREWQLDSLDLTVPEARLAAKGRWQAAGSRLMQLDFKLETTDGGALAERLGAGRVLRGGKGQAQGQLSWAGSPLAPDYPSMAGRVALALGAGQILQAEPGSARLLGVFSLLALPRRLTLDFRDLFQEGFAFDSATGNFEVARGVATTADLNLKGMQATVLVRGSADLRHETQDLQVLVVPNIDASAAALATMAINPAIGFGTLLAQLALREPLMAAGTREYRVSGAWADPVVQPVQRTAQSPLPPLEPLLPRLPAEPAAPASAPAGAPPAEKGSTG